MESDPLYVQAGQMLGALGEMAWQSFVVDLLHALHGVSDVQDIRTTKDQGADALIHSRRCCVACYGPRAAPSMPAFRKKVKGDYESYRLHWSKDYPHWELWVNWPPSPEQIRFVKSLNDQGQIVGRDRVRKHLKERPWGEQRPLLERLGVEPALIGRRLLQPLLDDLAGGNIPVYSPVDYHDRAPEIARKVNANYSGPDAEEALIRMRLSFDAQCDVEALLEQYGNAEIERIKSRVIRDFSDTGHVQGFHSRFITLCQRYDDKYNRVEDDLLSDYIRALVLYLFSQCHIGRAPTANEAR